MPVPGFHRCCLWRARRLRKLACLKSKYSGVLGLCGCFCRFSANFFWIVYDEHYLFTQVYRGKKIIKHWFIHTIEHTRSIIHEIQSSHCFLEYLKSMPICAINAAILVNVSEDTAIFGLVAQPKKNRLSCQHQSVFRLRWRYAGVQNIRRHVMIMLQLAVQCPFNHAEEF